MIQSFPNFFQGIQHADGYHTDRFIVDFNHVFFTTPLKRRPAAGSDVAAGWTKNELFLAWHSIQNAF